MGTVKRDCDMAVNVNNIFWICNASGKIDQPGKLLLGDKLMLITAMPIRWF